jgi:hypothetical protein
MRAVAARKEQRFVRRVTPPHYAVDARTMRCAHAGGSLLAVPVPSLAAGIAEPI